MDKVMEQIQALDESSTALQAQYELPDLDFAETKDPASIPTPDAIPEQNLRSEIPLEIRRSASVEALLSQNDDMLARLKVSLRRLALTENENDRLRKMHSVLETQNRALRDEVQIGREKEALFIEKERKLQSALEEFRSRFPEYQGLAEKLERYKKYHERIKTQVKPFIHQLKSYADSLSSEIRRLNLDLRDREVEIESLRAKRLEVEAHVEEMRQDAEERQCLIVAQYERQIESAQAEIRELLIKTSRLENRAGAYDELRIRESELENLVIALRRQKEDQRREDLENEQDLKSELGQQRSRVAELQEEIGDKAHKADVLKGENERLTSQNLNLSEQLASLRVLWGNKSRENEDLSARLKSLERLNLELSQSLAAKREQD